MLVNVKTPLRAFEESSLLEDKTLVKVKTLIEVFEESNLLEDRMLVKVKKLDDSPLPAYAHEGDVGCDLYAAEDVTLKVGERAVVGTGISVALPYGLGMFVMPRSGLALNYGITVLNSPGVVDRGFRDEVGVILINFGSSPFTVCRGMRIAQAVFLPFVRVSFVEVDDLPPSDRDGGFGHTGV